MIETKNTILRPVGINDIYDIYEYAKDEETGPRAGWPPHKNIETTRAIVEGWLSPDCDEEILAIHHKGDNKVIGTVGIVCLSERFKDDRNTYVKELVESGKLTYEIGTTISKQYWGRGVTTETLKATIDYIFDQKKADVIIVCHYAENVGSKKVQEKNKLREVFSYEREKPWFNTNCTTMIVREMTREEWIEQNTIQQ